MGSWCEVGRLQDWDDELARRIRASIEVVVIDVLGIAGVGVEGVLGIASVKILDTILNVGLVPVELAMIRSVSATSEIWGDFD